MEMARPLEQRAEGKHVGRSAGWCCVGAVGLLMMAPVVMADVQPVVHPDGEAPVRVQATYPEQGLPLLTQPGGTVGPPSDGSGGGSGSGSGGDGSGGATGYTGTTTADKVMGARSWGATVADNASAMGINPTAVAAFCELESGCLNPAANPKVGSASGSFQFIDTTYSAEIKQALAQNPSLAGYIDTSLAGKMDPVSEGIAAAQNLKNAATALQASGIADPTILDARGYSNFGPKYGAPLAQAPDSQLMSTVLSGYTQAQLTSNGVSAATTVGDWRNRISTKLGAAASQKVLI